MMPELVDDWLHFSPRQPKRKRAELVCLFCHSKKVKCDLQIRTSQGHTKCTNCDTGEQACQIRHSKRGKQKHVAFVEGCNHRDSSAAPADGTIAQHNNDADRQPGFQAVTNDQHLSSPNRQLRSDASNFDDNTVIGLEYDPRIIHTGPSDMRPPVRPTIQRQTSSTSPREGTGRSHTGDVDTGFLQVYGPEDQHEAEQLELVASLEPKFSEPPHEDLLQSFAETYWEFCYPWCPVLDHETIDHDLHSSALLANAVALAASHIRPPLVPHEGPVNYYNKARAIFYNDEESDSLTTLKALALFYWWAPRPPSIAHRHSSWWWTSLIIRIAQQMNIHREPAEGNPLRDRLHLSLRRRIWWTAFARERLTALCQSKPCIIDPEDCTISEPQLTDFPDDPVSQKSGQVFIYWIRLCSIIGRIAKHLSLTSSTSGPASPTHLVQELSGWVQSLPPHLQLPIKSARTGSFDRDVHQLHLPYLTTIIILHLRKSTFAENLPQAFPPAILAASCIARIMRDVLSRGDTRFLMAITCWYIGTAYIALLQARRIAQFASEAQEGLNILDRSAEQLQKMWGSADIIRRGFERLKTTCSPEDTQRPTSEPMSHFTSPDLSNGQIPGTHADSGALLHPHHVLTYHEDDFDWTLLFPFVTPATSHIADLLLNDHVQHNLQTPADSPFREALWSQYQDLLVQPFADDIFDFSEAMGLH